MKQEDSRRLTVRFNLTKESDRQAWERLKELADETGKSMNQVVIEEILREDGCLNRIQEKLQKFEIELHEIHTELQSGTISAKPLEASVPPKKEISENVLDFFSQF